MPTYPTFPPAPFAYGPSFPLDKTVDPLILSNEFGDGYNQEVADGINNQRPQLSLSWDALSAADKNLLEAFFVERGGWQPFMWTFPGDGAQTKWKCRPWTVKLTHAKLWAINATFIRDFTP